MRCGALQEERHVLLLIACYVIKIYHGIIPYFGFYLNHSPQIFQKAPAVRPLLRRPAAYVLARQLPQAEDQACRAVKVAFCNIRGLWSRSQDGLYKYYEDYTCGHIDIGYVKMLYTKAPPKIDGADVTFSLLFYK